VPALQLPIPAGGQESTVQPATPPTGPQLLKPEKLATEKAVPMVVSRFPPGRLMRTLQFTFCVPWTVPLGHSAGSAEPPLLLLISKVKFWATQSVVLVLELVDVEVLDEVVDDVLDDEVLDDVLVDELVDDDVDDDVLVVLDVDDEVLVVIDVLVVGVVDVLVDVDVVELVVVLVDVVVVVVVSEGQPLAAPFLQTSLAPVPAAMIL
jgi:hypothetical protein